MWPNSRINLDELPDLILEYYVILYEYSLFVGVDMHIMNTVSVTVQDYVIVHEYIIQFPLISSVSLHVKPIKVQHMAWYAGESKEWP